MAYKFETTIGRATVKTVVYQKKDETPAQFEARCLKAQDEANHRCYQLS